MTAYVARFKCNEHFSLVNKYLLRHILLISVSFSFLSCPLSHSCSNKESMCVQVYYLKQRKKKYFIYHSVT